MFGDDTIRVIVLDSCNYPSPPKRIEFVVCKSDTVETLRLKIAVRCRYPKDSFDLKCAKQLTDPNEEKTLEEFGFSGIALLSLFEQDGFYKVLYNLPPPIHFLISCHP